MKKFPDKSRLSRSNFKQNFFPKCLVASLSAQKILNTLEIAFDSFCVTRECLEVCNIALLRLKPCLKYLALSALIMTIVLLFYSVN